MWLMARAMAVLSAVVLLSCPERVRATTDLSGELETVVVTAGRQEEKAFEIPQAVTVVDRKAIEAQSPQVVSDLLRGETGVYTQSSGPGQGVVIVRGLKGSEVLHLVDGMRLNNAFFRNSPSQYLALVDPNNIDSIEVVRGPSASHYGSDAMGGVVQMLTPEPRFESSNWAWSGQAGLTYNTANLGWTSRLSAAVGRKAVSLTAGYTYLDYESQLIGDGERVGPTAYWGRGYDAKLLLEPASAHHWMLSASVFEMPNLPRYFEVAGGPGGEGSSVQAFFRPNDRRFLHARYRYLRSLGFVDSLEVHVARQEINDERFRQPNQDRVENESNRSVLDGLTVQLSSNPGPFELRYGLELYRDQIDSSKTRSSLPEGPTEADISSFPDGSQQTSFGVYALGDWRPVSRWLLEAGLRYSSVETDLTETRFNDKVSVDDEGYTGNLGSAVSLSSRLNWTVNLAKGYRAPNLFDLGTLGRRPNTSPEQVNVPNAGLGPETLTSIDTGLKWLDSNWSAEVSLWASRYEDKIEAREPTGNLVPEGQLGCATPEGCVEVRSENITDAQYHGVEAGLRVRPIAAVQTYATLNYTYGSERRGSEGQGPANRVPPLNGQVGLIWSASPRWELEPYLLWADRQNRLDDDDRNDTRIDPDGTDAWATLNTRATWIPSPQVRLQLTAINLLDESYREHGSGIDGVGRSLIASAKWRF